MPESNVNIYPLVSLWFGKRDPKDTFHVFISEYLQYVAKSIATYKKNPYIINQNHIFSKKYCEVISG